MSESGFCADCGKPIDDAVRYSLRHLVTHEVTYFCQDCWNTRWGEEPTTPPDPLADFAADVRLIAAEQTDLLIAKQRDYGPLNISNMGEAGLLVRINDKIERLKNLCMSDAQPTQEAIDDTLMDIANYATIWRMGRRGLWPVPFADVVVRRRG